MKKTIAVDRLAKKYLEDMGLTRPQIDYLKSVIDLAYITGMKAGSKDAYKDAIRIIKK